MTYKSNVNRKFEDNEPAYGNIESLKSTNNLVENTNSKYSIDGEIVELQKRHYGTKDASQLLDRSFSELTKTRDGISSANFFNLYRELFFDIPKVGENSHTTLMLESKEYINDYVDPKDDKIEQLLDRIIELETEKTQFPTEHPIYRNGSFLRRQAVGGPLGLMQEGRLRPIAYRVYRSLRKPLGYVNQNGKPLSDRDIQVIIGDATWNELPKWPNEAAITEENPNLNASLSDFLTPSQLDSDLNSLVSIRTNIQSAILTKEEIDILKNSLDNKIPSTSYGIEGNFDGTFKWGPEDLLPFNSIGNAQGETRLLNTTLANNSSPTSIELEIFDRFNIFANRMATIGLGINSPNFVDISLNSAQIIDNAFENDIKKQQAEEFISAKKQLISDLQNFSNAIINGGGYEQYRWDVDPDRSTTDNNNKFYWVKEAIESEVEVPKIFAAINQIENNNDFVYNF
tara:strand:+ start:44 stop:1414 length:1371 start_codon:yes stop_codon:yes gene_type:complete